MSTRRRAGERARAADPVANPFVRRPLRDPLTVKPLRELLNDAVGTARAAAEVESTYSARAAAEGDARGETSHDLLAQTHDAYATALAAFARLAADEADARGEA